MSRYTMRVTCTECGYTGTLAAVELHSCDIQRGGGWCEDYPCCGHTDGDGCQTLPEHTSAYYLDNPRMMFEPGSPEWYEELDRESERYDDDEPESEWYEELDY